MRKPIFGHTEYSIDINGVVKKGRKIIKQHETLKGYMRVNLMTDGKFRKYYVHRLTAMTFMPKTSLAGLSVDHIDHDRSNNNVKNLRWVTHLQNIRNRRNTKGDE